MVGQRPAVVLAGARQVGKTSLLKRLLPNHNFVSLDLPLDAAQAEDHPKEFLTAHPPPLIIDEVQYAPGVFRHVKVVVDKHRQDKGRFVLTGSQRFPLMKNVADSLAGRAAIVEMEPLSYREIHRALPSLNVEEIVVRGGYPELYEDLAIDRSEFYRSYLASYLGTSRGSLTLRSRRSTPKLYWNDSGFLCWLTGIHDAEALRSAPLVGAIWETFVCSELRRRQLALQGGTSIHFWRDREREVDFLIHHGGRFELMDAKWTSEPTARDAAQLDAVAVQLGADRVLSRRVLCRTPAERYLVTANGLGPDAAWFDGDEAPAE